MTAIQGSFSVTPSNGIDIIPDITGLVQGSGGTTRIGNKIFVKWIKFIICFKSAGTIHGLGARAILYSNRGTYN